jgi:N-acetylglucosaminyldiphosphoundecaprenol N-acetyl-beta-D-mannosaminyltransferase
MPLVWMARRLGHPGTERVYGPDLMRAVTEMSAREGFRQFYYGGPPGLASELGSKLETEYRGLKVAGAYSPPFGEMTVDEDDRIVALINAARPDILWVGLSTPKQELWMARHLGRIDAPVMIGVGAAFDFLAGTKRQAPGWVGQHGLEWLFRLLTEPKRLWRRYARIVPVFLVKAGLQLYRHRRARELTRTS